MAKGIIRSEADGRSSIVSLLLFVLIFSVPETLHSQQLSQGEFSKELRSAFSQNNEALAASLIKNNRLLVKPFVNEVIIESIGEELGGRAPSSIRSKEIAERTASIFESTFREKSLSIGVGYLKIWSSGEKQKKLTADSLYALGTSLRGNPQELEKVIGLYEQALNLYKEIGDERGESEILGGMGLVYSTTEIQKSLKYYEEALIKREKVDDRQLIGNTLNSLGATYFNLKDYPQSIIYYEKAETIRSEIGDSVNLQRTKSLKAKAFLNQAEVIRDEGRYTEALEYLEKSLSINKSINLQSGIIESLNQIGYVHFKTGDYNSALEKYNEALKLAKEQDDKPNLAGVYNNLGVLLQNTRKFEKALEYYNSALKLYEESGDRNSLLVLTDNLGTINFDLKEYGKAEEYHSRGVTLSRELKDRDQEASCLLNLANDQILLGKFDEAMDNYHKAMEIARSLNNPDLIWKINGGMAESWEHRGNYEKAVAMNDSALRIIENLRSTLTTDEQKAGYMATEHFAYEDVISTLAKFNEKEPDKGYDSLAFRYAEQSKARVLLELLTASKEKFGDLGSSKPFTITEAMALCPDKKTILLEYSLGDSSSCLWVVSKSGFKLFKLPERKVLQEQIESFRYALSTPDEKSKEFLINGGVALYQSLVEPAASFIKDRSRLIIIPDGILNYLPFEVLLTGKPGIENSFSSLPYLVKKYSVSYVQSASILKSLLSMHASEPKTHGNKSLVAFGDPVYEGENGSSRDSDKKFERLLYSGKEIENITKYFKEGEREIFLRDDANEGNVKKNDELEKFNYIHFATHGFIDERNPGFSSLVLSRKNPDDGLLQSAEIFNLKLNADLVVLSACQTGLGKMVRGEGMIGLTRAFMYAGTPALLVSLWSVSDISTSAFMSEFYRNLVKEKQSKTEALRKAQLFMLGDEKFAHPFYWAPFVIIGDWK